MNTAVNAAKWLCVALAIVLVLQLVVLFRTSSPARPTLAAGESEYGGSVQTAPGDSQPPLSTEPPTIKVVDHTPPPRNEPIGKREVREWMRNNVADPEAEIVEYAEPQMVAGEMLTNARIRAKNAYGGWVMQDLVFFHNRHGQLQGMTVPDYTAMIVAEKLYDGVDRSVFDAQFRGLKPQ